MTYNKIGKTTPSRNDKSGKIQAKTQGTGGIPPEVREEGKKQDMVYQSLTREDTNHTLSKKAKDESHRDGFLIQATNRLDWFGSPAA